MVLAFLAGCGLLCAPPVWFLGAALDGGDAVAVMSMATPYPSRAECEASAAELRALQTIRTADGKSWRIAATLCVSDGWAV